MQENLFAVFPANKKKIPLIFLSIFIFYDRIKSRVMMNFFLVLCAQWVFNKLKCSAGRFYYLYRAVNCLKLEFKNGKQSQYQHHLQANSLFKDSCNHQTLWIEEYVKNQVVKDGFLDIKPTDSKYTSIYLSQM